MKGYLLIPLLNIIIFPTLGYVVKYKKVLEILANYDSDKIKNKEGLAKWIGNSFFLLGAISLVLLLLGYCDNNINGKLFVIINVFLMFIFIIIVAVGARRY